MRKNHSYFLMALLVMATLIFTGCESLNTPLAIDRSASSDDEQADIGDLGVDTSAATASGATEQELLPSSEVTGIVSNTEATEGHEGSTGSVILTLTDPSYRKKDVTSEYDKSSVVKISLKKDSITVNGPGATPDGSTVTITKAGDYLVTGTLKDGTITVNASAGDDVRLILSDADISCSYAAPISCLSADKLIITLDEGTSNTITDSGRTIGADEKQDAALWSDSKLSINGTGSLTIKADAGHGINCRDELKLISGVITIASAKCGLRAREGLAVSLGTINISAGTDAIRTGSDSDAAAGWVVIDGGVISLNAGSDGIQAGTSVEIKGGSLDIVTGGGSEAASKGSFSFAGWFDGKASSDTDTSKKGIKCDGAFYMLGGLVKIDAEEDGVNSESSICVDGGTLSIKAGDDGLHADNDMLLAGGTVTVEKSYEGLEALAITIAGGNISVTAEDDGINASGGKETETGRQQGMLGNARGGFFGGAGSMFAVTEGAAVTITGGNLYVNAEGDGIDSNGDILMTGGVVMVDGPTRGGNGAIDHNGKATITGGTIVASGSSDMVENFDKSSEQNVILVYFGSTVPAGTTMVLKNDAGEEILGFTTGKTSQCAVISSPLLETGGTYSLYSGDQVIAGLKITERITESGRNSRKGMPDRGTPWGGR